MPRRLRTQISVSMIALAVTTLATFIVGMAVFYTQLQRSWVEGLSQANRETLEELVANGDVHPDELTTLINAFSLSWSDGYADQEFLAVVAFCCLALICAIVLGIFLAGRLSRPIEAVTQAAERVAVGKLDHRIEEQKGDSVETEELVLSFNQMVRSLDQAERESAASAAAIAHELRTPLTILRGKLQGIADGAFDPTGDLLQGLVAQVDILSRIVDDLAWLSRLSAGRFNLEIRTVNLAEEADQVMQSVLLNLRQQGFEIDLKLAPVLLQGDGARIRQALNALISNARKYADEGKYLQIATYIEGESAILSVTDHGPGIANHDKERIFDRWWRAEESRTRSSGGSGLGLSIVKAIAQAHGGEVGVKDAEGGMGTTLWLALPIQNRCQ